MGTPCCIGAPGALPPPIIVSLTNVIMIKFSFACFRFNKTPKLKVIKRTKQDRHTGNSDQSYVVGVLQLHTKRWLKDFVFVFATKTKKKTRRCL